MGLVTRMLAVRAQYVHLFIYFEMENPDLSNAVIQESRLGTERREKTVGTGGTGYMNKI
jgi:hypothetical protein